MTDQHQPEQIIELRDDASGLAGYLVIDSTARGPGFGGIRLGHYQSAADALADARELARAMTLKTALAELPCGGVKTALIDHPGLDRARAFRFLAEVANTLEGRVFLGPDAGVGDADLALMGGITKRVASPADEALGDIAWYTAYGVLNAMLACAEHLGRELRTVAIQGVGKVGRRLAHLLHKRDVRVVVSDPDQGRLDVLLREIEATVVAPHELFAVECDALAPCAIDAIPPSAVASFRTSILCGSANSQLATPEMAESLRRQGILYAPDFLVNSGGVIRGVEYYLLRRSSSLRSVRRIGRRTALVLEEATRRGVSPQAVAMEKALAAAAVPAR